jgi:hypothetical protein
MENTDTGVSVTTFCETVKGEISSQRWGIQDEGLALLIIGGIGVGENMLVKDVR